ncbi:hypothetical protein ABXS75_09115 [Roseburia hominis]
MRMLLGNDEEKRSKMWSYVTIIATVLIVIVVIYFLFAGFMGNPLKGTWLHDESSMTLEIGRGGKAVLRGDDLVDGKDLELEMDYTLNRKGKQITFKASEEELEEAAKKLGDDVTAADVEMAVDMMFTSFNYSVDGKELTLSEWDYGDQLFFERKR